MISVELTGGLIVAEASGETNAWVTEFYSYYEYVVAIVFLNYSIATMYNIYFSIL